MREIYVYKVSECDYLKVRYDPPFVHIEQQIGQRKNVITLFDDNDEVAKLIRALEEISREVWKKIRPRGFNKRLEIPRVVRDEV